MEVFRFMTVRPPEGPPSKENAQSGAPPVVRVALADRASGEGHFFHGENAGAGRDALQARATSLAALHREDRLFSSEVSTLVDGAGHGSLSTSPETLRRLREADFTLPAMEGDATLPEAYAAAALSGAPGAPVRELATALRLRAFQERFGNAGDVPAGALEDYLEAPILVEDLERLIGGTLRGEEDLGDLSDDDLSDDDFIEERLGDHRRAYFGPVGIGDLEVVEQRLLRYEMGEVAHVENVMRTEFRERVHRSLNRSEERLLEETERTTETEEDLQTAERFELQSEVEREIEREQELQAGLSVTAKYGPIVEATATLDYAARNAKRASNRRSSRYAQEVTARSLRRLQERVREEREERVTRETEEQNTHRFDNTGDGSAHAVGVYRYVDKVYEAQLVNYGERLLFEFFVPEPAAWLRWAREQNGAASTNGTQPPTAPRILPRNVTLSNYQREARAFEVADLPAPPPTHAQVAFTHEDTDTGGKGGQPFIKGGKIAIPDGYEAAEARVTVSIRSRPDDTNSWVWVAVGDDGVGTWREGRPSQSTTDTKTKRLDGQRGEIGYSINAWHDSAMTVLVEVKCERTEEALDAWRHEVYAAIWDAYQKKVADYEGATAAVEAPFLPEMPPPPARLREMERTELKRRVIEMLGQFVAAADPLNEGDLPLVLEEGEAPLEEGNLRADLSKLEVLAPQIRFAEQAFEWAQMSYVFYPYYWAAPEDWPRLAFLEHADPLHAQFLRAGAARLLVPVRLGFEKAVHYFLASGGQIAPEAEAPDITSEAWLPLWREIQEQQGKAAEERAVIDCWEVTLPTTLVMLDPADALPENQPSASCRALLNGQGGDGQSGAEEDVDVVDVDVEEDTDEPVFEG